MCDAPSENDASTSSGPSSTTRWSPVRALDFHSISATWQAASIDLREAWGRFSEVVAPAKVTRGFLLGAVLGSWISADKLSW